MDKYLVYIPHSDYDETGIDVVEAINFGRNISCKRLCPWLCLCNSNSFQSMLLMKMKLMDQRISMRRKYQYLVSNHQSKYSVKKSWRLLKFLNLSKSKNKNHRYICVKHPEQHPIFHDQTCCLVPSDSNKSKIVKSRQRRKFTRTLHFPL